MTIKATGYQWKWGYEYLDHDVQFYSTHNTKNQIKTLKKKYELSLEVDNHVVVPVGKKFAFLLLLMMFYMLGMYPLLLLNKMLFLDSSETHGLKLKRQEFTEVNVRIMWKEHAYMPIVVEVVTEDQFNQWVLDNQTTKTTKLNINE